MSCPYCRSKVTELFCPPSYDAFAMYYFWTRFRRMKCENTDCSNKEYPMNNGLCSRCMYPSISKEEIHQMMKCLFPYFYFPLHIKKLMLMILYNHIVKYNDDIDSVFEIIKYIVDVNTRDEVVDFRTIHFDLIEYRATKLVDTLFNLRYI